MSEYEEMMKIVAEALRNGVKSFIGQKITAETMEKMRQASENALVRLEGSREHIPMSALFDVLAYERAKRIENEIIAILDEIDERFAASKYYGPDPFAIRRLRFKLALAERRHIMSSCTDHAIERFCCVHPGNSLLKRTRRWLDAAVEMEWLEGPVCPKVIGAEGRSETVLRAAQEIIAAIRALPNLED